MIYSPTTTILWEDLFASELPQDFLFVLMPMIGRLIGGGHLCFFV